MDNTTIETILAESHEMRESADESIKKLNNTISTLEDKVSDLETNKSIMENFKDQVIIFQSALTIFQNHSYDYTEALESIESDDMVKDFGDEYSKWRSS